VARAVLPRIPYAAVTAAVESARQEWETGYRRFLEASHDAAVGERLHRQLDVVAQGLRRRVGAVFSLEDLVDVYGTAESWIHATLDDRGEGDWPATLTLVGEAAFYLHSRSATDFTL
jgi:hypothetical protein